MRENECAMTNLVEGREKLTTRSARTEQEQSPVEMVRAQAKRMKDLFKEHQIRIPELGATIGKSIVYELCVLHILSDLPRNLVMGEVEKIHAFYEELFGDTSDYEAVRKGFMAEFAVAYAFSEQIGYPVYLPTPEEDTHAKIDLIVDLEDGEPPLGIQIKSLNLQFDPNQIIYELTDADFKELGAEINNTALLEKMQSDAQAMEAYCSKNNLRPLMLVVPSAQSDSPLYNDRTGLPVQQTSNGEETMLANRIYNELEEKELITW